MSAMGLVGVMLTVALAALLTHRWWQPALKSTGKITVQLRSALLAAKGGNSMSAQPALEKKTEEAKPDGRKRLRPRIIKYSLAAIAIIILILPWEASTGSDCALLLPPGRESVVRANTDAVLREIYVQQGDAVAEGTKLARLANPEIEDRLTQLDAEIERLNTNASRLEDELRVRSESLLSASFKETERRRIASELKQESAQIAASRSSNESKPLPATLAVL
jgi:hypothetical protein